MKIVHIGAGSFVFAPTVLRDAIARHRLDGWQLVLVDPDAELVTAMAGMGRAMALQEGVGIEVEWTTDRAAALPGADFVILSAAIEGARRWHMDYEICERAGIPGQARECGGLGGLGYALRSVTLALQVCRDMERLCPDALLLSVTNPLPRVLTAVRSHSRIRAIGFCNAAYQAPNGYGWLAGLLGRAEGDLRVTTAGLNHFAWLVDIRHAQTGEDLYPIVEDRVREGRGPAFQVLQNWLAEYGAVGVSGAHHMMEYLPASLGRGPAHPPFHGTPEERRRRHEVLQAVAEGAVSWRDAELRFSWEHPVDVAAALARNEEAPFDMVNVPNEAWLSDLPEGRIVEVPACASAGRLSGCPVGRLPGRVSEICRAVSDVHEMVAEATATGDRALARRAVEIDPAIREKGSAMRALEEMLAAHADVLPQFG
jgi:alpha-galactosidase/6-phospho-beta-glucosidase family protein